MLSFPSPQVLELEALRKIVRITVGTFDCSNCSCLLSLPPSQGEYVCILSNIAHFKVPSENAGYDFIKINGGFFHSSAI